MDKTNFLLSALKSTFYWFLIAFITLVLFLPVLFIVLFIYPFDSGRKGIHPLISFWAKCILIACPLMNVQIEGQKQLNPEETYVLVSNHQSIADIIVALHLRQSFKFIAKKELFWIPIFGWAMGLAGYIPLVRGNHHSGKEALIIAESLIKRGISVLFFPEGTRSLDGEIHTFKAGAFKLAAETGVSVVPMVIDGTFNFVPKGSRLFLRKVRVRLKVLSPHQVLGQTNGSIETLMNEVRSDMVEALSELRSRKEIEVVPVS